jgi:hypothetical protein
VEAVVLALVGHVGRGADHLARIDEPNLVRCRALDRRPADEAGRIREHLLGLCLPAHVEPERGTPSGHARADVCADVCVERVGAARHPGQCGRDRHCRHAQRRLPAARRPHDRPIVERLARRELEVVARSPFIRGPLEGRRPRERVERGLVCTEQERAQPGRPGRHGALRGGHERDRGEREEDADACEHCIPFSAAAD